MDESKLSNWHPTAVGQAGVLLIGAICAVYATACAPVTNSIGSTPDGEPPVSVETTEQNQLVEQVEPRPTSVSNARKSAAFNTNANFRRVGGFVVLDDPEIVSGTDDSDLMSDGLVLGVNYPSVSRAYPVSMAEYHHIINAGITVDDLGIIPLLVTY
jgi:hypothetical protein